MSCMMQQLLRGLPKVDVLAERVKQKEMLPESHSVVLTEAVRAVLDSLRGEIVDGSRNSLPGDDELCGMVLREFHARRQRSLRHVINATGIALHTNLGRSILSKAAVEAVTEAAGGYSTLEYRLREGERGSRYEHVEGLLKELCGCEAAMVVNNNAAAVMLILSTMAKDCSVVISRGELVEIGGSFRVPEIMEMSGCRLIEVGTTNKTHPYDYERGIQEDTALLLKVHTSNFKITGFTETVSLQELTELGKERNLPVVYDMGSGSLVSLNRLPGIREPNAKDAVRAGADIVSFSGDKLLGGPQAGIIVGKREYIDAMKRNPLTRVLRVDKMTLAGLEATLRQYREEDVWETIPTLHMLEMSRDELLGRSMTLCQLLRAIPGLTAVELEDEAPAGGGSVPGVLFPTRCVAVAFPGVSANELECRLRLLPHPIVARIRNEQVLLDVKTIQTEELEALREGFLLLSEELREMGAGS